MRSFNHVEVRAPLTLGEAAKGFKGTVASIDASGCAETGLEPCEIECRLMEMGFTEGAEVEIKHEGFWGRDPIAVKVNNMTVALRRREANAIHIIPAGVP
ncbi:MAG: FeoA family protein [Alphaproteobacteria bacterium]|nr:FeoA family protein [Alphaproteobacteria bacterium]